MLIKKYVTVEGKTYPVTLSDDSEALQAAYAAGGAIIGIWSPAKESGNFPNCLYLTDDPEHAGRTLLEKAVRRRLGLPLIIGETERLVIREFRSEDPLEDEEVLESEILPESDALPEFDPLSDSDPLPVFASPGNHGKTDNRVFCSRELRDAYIANQYRFCECGLWALEDKTDGILVGKAGITDGELGYHIYRPYRRRGFAEEACRKICEYAGKEMELEVLCLKTHDWNRPSICLAERLGFAARIRENGLLIYEKRLIPERPEKTGASAREKQRNDKEYF